MYGVRNWLTPMHSTSALALSICLARFSLICVGIAFLRGRSTAAKHHPPCPRTRNLVGDRNPREHEVVVQRRSFDSGKSGANQAAVTATLVLSRIGGAEGDRTPRYRDGMKRAAPLQVSQTPRKAAKLIERLLLSVSRRSILFLRNGTYMEPMAQWRAARKVGASSS